jgi:hypothetical protein
VLRWRQDWYLAHCDGEWEHGYAVEIRTLDNPGWRVRIHLEGTELEGPEYGGIDERFRSDEDWIVCRVVGQVFEGFGGARNLTEILCRFREWATG